MFGIDRTMYKLLVLCLALIASFAALAMYNDLARLLKFSGGGLGFQLALTVVGTVLQFLLSLCALYWIPKVIKKFFPEIA